VNVAIEAQYNEGVTSFNDKINFSVRPYDYCYRTCFVLELASTGNSTERKQFPTLFKMYTWLDSALYLPSTEVVKEFEYPLYDDMSI